MGVHRSAARALFVRALFTRIIPEPASKPKAMT